MCILCSAVSIFCSCLFAMTYIDTSALYHIIRAQSVIKLYVIYNMLEVSAVFLINKDRQ